MSRFVHYSDCCNCPVGYPSPNNRIGNHEPWCNLMRKREEQALEELSKKIDAGEVDPAKELAKLFGEGPLGRYGTERCNTCGEWMSKHDMKYTAEVCQPKKIKALEEERDALLAWKKNCLIAVGWMCRDLGYNKEEIKKITGIDL